ncbi:Holliday junction branch migration protein RuvA [Erysipelotrichaceae bacterium OttesenSCG-928-M19]|nr:Holliday junction branch migration protein RuvA [Erysipelotrichaceae bacterium OttesenSCG-928-M19]
MIGYLKGNVILINKDSIIVDVRDVGYHVITCLPYDYKIGEAVELYVYTHVKEDLLLLYGFKELAQKEIFLKLISVKGVGPKTAIGILSSIDYLKLVEAIDNEDISFLKKIPGIGLKSASQIVLDLKGKFVVDKANINEELNDALDALNALGYKDSEIKKIEKELSNHDLNTEEYIKMGLQLLLK